MITLEQFINEVGQKYPDQANDEQYAAFVRMSKQFGVEDAQSEQEANDRIVASLNRMIYGEDYDLFQHVYGPNEVH